MTTPRSHVTSHVLDSTLGRPARDVAVLLEKAEAGEWMIVASARTDADGRVSSLGPVALPAGSYRVTFDTGLYFTSTAQPVFYPSVAVAFVLADEGEHYHIPLLLSPFAYSTYRGS
ncbi:hydroxyisourate hydrolase [Subtercola boreus]|uniref:5-hydroxyisourate hydrolase n=1 Tax=Subtercola boreus TaxID=120213 RepID=A0A3E0WDS0_9MICO|nr:hydroxyisourate hydrolase [Subtercola boreus]RFA22421.1 hydroxyisourate hydrolase [Subtercola boreus]RFA22483.1 hydroxyisourate hydrolase [Subtercola boreus]RFA28498.1 hydroxyisourate hydrolase [Subtercola boreus]